MEKFDGIYIYAKIGNTWVDLSADVMASPSIRCDGIGIMSLSPFERVGSVSSLSFTLNNSESNSVGIRGYYTPRGTNAMSGWDAGLKVRMVFVYDGIYKTPFYGRIDSGGIVLAAGLYGERTANISCSGWIREAENSSIELIEYQTNKRADEGIEIVLDNMLTKPLKRSLQQGVEIFPSLFDITRNKTKAVAEFTKLTNSELGYFYVRGDKSPSDYVGGEVLIFENRQHRYGQRDSASNIPLHSSIALDSLLMETGDALLLESGDNILLEAGESAIFGPADFSINETMYGRNVYNRARITSYPRKVDDSDVVLWNLEKSLFIQANGKIEGLRGSYRDPGGGNSSVSGINMIAPVASTDYTANSAEDGSGSDLTSDLTVTASYGTAEVSYRLENTGSTDMWVTLLQARGYGVYIYDTASVLYQSDVSMEKYGVNEISFEFPYVSDAANLFGYSNNIDRILLESGDFLLYEDDTFVEGDDGAGIFDVLVYDQPSHSIGNTVMTANSSKRNMMAFMSLDAGSYIKISEPMSGIDATHSHIINGYGFTVEAGGIVRWLPSLVSTVQFPKI